MAKEERATVQLPDGRTFPVEIQRDLRCTIHGGQPGWGCESCRDSIVNAIVGFKPLAMIMDEEAWPNAET